MIKFVPDRPGHDQKYAMSHQKITDELGWEPKFGLGETLQQMVEWYKVNQAWWKKLKARNT